MATLKTSDIEKSLTTKGFEKQSTHHDMFWYKHNGKKTSIRTRLSHSSKEIGDNLISAMAKQVKLKRTEFEELIACPLTIQQYEAILIAKGELVVVQVPPIVLATNAVKKGKNKK